MRTIATLCARGGSVGVPGKNIKELNGKPLICYSIEQAKACEFIDEVIISTDDPTIAAIAEAAGARVPFLRPAALAQDDTPKLDAITHIIKKLEAEGERADVIIDLDVSSPLRNIEDIHHCFHLLTQDVDLVITGYLANKNPYFNMVELDRQGFVTLSKRPAQTVTSRQSAPKVFAMNASIYVWHRHTLERPLWENKRIKIYEMPLERSIDIDTPTDWKLVQLLMNEKLQCKH